MADTSRVGLRLALITPARNEGKFIRLTMESVIKQTVRPVSWVIVSDGSIDDTDDIVSEYLSAFPWIKLIRLPERKERDFAGKVNAFNAGLEQLRCESYDLIGSLDADISFDETYFEFLLQRFADDAQLGVAGTPFSEYGRQYDYRFTSTEHVSGACQIFRRQCFEGIGGYRPIPSGGIDLIAVVTARMKGWRTRSFTEKSSVHHRAMGTAKRGVVHTSFHNGFTDYTHGCDWVWQICRSVYQTTRRPFVIGGVCCLTGYICAFATGAGRVVVPEVVQFRKEEQRKRLRAFLQRLLEKRRDRSVLQNNEPTRMGIQ